MDVYDAKADEFFNRYEGIDASVLYKDLISFIPRNGNCVDIGCGSGRDAKWLSSLKNKVIAIDPSVELLKRARQKHGNEIEWKLDRLPDLKSLSVKNYFDLILVTGVWMHIPPVDRRGSAMRIEQLLKPSGIVVISYRNSTTETDRTFYSVNLVELKRIFKRVNLKTILVRKQEDILKRDKMIWTQLVLQRM